ncbi:MAG: hypothetical protein EPO68_14965 [Planctomycetota bacterium]|nr:MAG: hypothetical protein EPO68_14965 [Planctomycetota bacterium]
MDMGPRDEIRARGFDGASGRLATAPRSTWDRIGPWLALLAVACLLFQAAWRANSQWELGTRGEIGAGYTAYYVRCMLEQGWSVTRGAAVARLSAGDPPHVELQFHHPALYWWYHGAWAQFAGASPLALRAAHALLIAPAALFLYALARRFLAPIGAGAAALLFAAIPLVGYWAPMVNQDGAVLTALLGALLAFQRWREHASTARLAVFLAAVAWAANLDWLGYACVPVCALWTLGDGGFRAARRALAAALFVELGCIALFALHARLALGAWADVGHELARIAMMPDGPDIFGALGTPGPTSIATPQHLGLAEIARIVGTLGLREFDPLLLCGALLGAVALWRRRGARRALVPLAALASAGLWNVALFPQHAAYHEFWLLASAPAVALALGALFDVLFTARGPRVAALACAGVAALAAHGIGDTLARVEERRTTSFEPLAALLDAQFGASDLVCMPIAVPQILPLTRCQLRFDCRTPEQLRIEAQREPRPAGRFVYVLARPAEENEWTRRLAAQHPLHANDGLHWFELDPAGAW